MAPLIPLKDNPKWLKDLGKIFVSNIWHLKRRRTDIVSDWDRYFHILYAEICDLVDIRRRMCTPYQRRTYGHPNTVHHTLDLYLHTFCSFEQDNWNEILAMAEYAYNNSVTSTTAISLFDAIYESHPTTNRQT
jgi:hypothetical protein